MTVVAALAGSVLLLADWGAPGPLVGRRAPVAGGTGTVAEAGSSASSSSRSGSSRSCSRRSSRRLVAMAVSRQREYLADASGAELTRNPLALASALEKIDAAVEPTPIDQAGRRAPLHRGPARPRRRTPRARSGWASLFATHPPIAQRIAILREMGYAKRPTSASADAWRGAACRAASRRVGAISRPPRPGGGPVVRYSARPAVRQSRSMSRTGLRRVALRLLEELFELSIQHVPLRLLRLDGRGELLLPLLIVRLQRARPRRPPRRTCAASSALRGR